MLFERKKTAARLTTPPQTDSRPSIAESLRPAVQIPVHSIFHGSTKARCYTDWDRLADSEDQRVKVCPDCDGVVYKLAEVPESQISALVVQTLPYAWTGHCRLHRRFDGTYSSSEAPCFIQGHSRFCSERLSTILIRTLAFASLACVIFGVVASGFDYLQTILGIAGFVLVIVLACSPIAVMMSYSIFDTRKLRPVNYHPCHRLTLLAPLLYIFTLASAPLLRSVRALDCIPFVLFVCQVVIGALLLRLYKKDQRKYFRNRLGFHLFLGLLVALMSALMLLIHEQHTSPYIW